MRYPTLILSCLLVAVPAVAQQQPDTIARAATQPLRDVRLREDKIPPILQKAVAAPYSLAGMTSCATIAAEVGRLTKALGADVDGPARNGSQSSEIAAEAAGAAVDSVVPGLGLLKIVTGADKQQKRVQAAVYAGSVRRGFLKGVGLSRRCAAPAAPRGGTTR